MGVSTDGILAYGYNLGGDDSGWEIEQAGEYGDWEPSWIDTDAEEIIDIAVVIEDQLLASVGFTEGDWEVDGYHDRKRDAQTRLGVELKTYCSDNSPMYLLCAHSITAYRGHVKTIGFAELDKQRVEQDWDAKLKRATEALGVTPKQAAPSWLLVSYWG